MPSYLLFLFHNNKVEGLFISKFPMQWGFFLSPFNETHIIMVNQLYGFSKEV